MRSSERQRRVAGAFVAVVVAVGLSGCGSAAGMSSASAPSAASVSASASSAGAVRATVVSGGPWTSCRAEAGPALDPGPHRLPVVRLSHAFVARSAVWCETADRTNADGSQDELGLDQRTTDPAALAQLVAALRLPDLAAPPSTLCDLVGYVQPLLFLLDSRGHWERPALPTDGCGFPRRAVLTAVRQTPRRTVASWVITRTESAGAARTGCSQQWSDMVHVETAVTGGARPALSTADPFAGIARIRVCVYAVPRGEFGGGKPAGTLTGGALVSGTPRDRLGSLLTGLVTASPCRREATRFALITQIDIGRDPTAYVELDGCRRAMVERSVISGAYSRQREALSQAGDALVSFLDATGTTG